MASSHAPSLFAQTYGGWQRLWDRFRVGNSGPPQIAVEGPEAVAEFVERSAVAFGRLRAALAAYEPDVLVVIAGDQHEWFAESNVPNLMIYAGEGDIVGFHNFGADDEEPRVLPWEHPERFGVRLHVDHERAEQLLEGLVAKGFDVAVSRRVPASADPKRAAPHALVRPLPLVLPRPNLPIIPVMMKTVERSPAILTGARCLELGRAIAEVFGTNPGRIALYGSGGLSHDPLGPRAGWVDEPLDRWVLQQLADGTPDRLGGPLRVPFGRDRIRDRRDPYVARRCRRNGFRIAGDARRGRRLLRGAQIDVRLRLGDLAGAGVRMIARRTRSP